MGRRQVVGSSLAGSGEKGLKAGDQPQQKPGGVSFFDIFGAIRPNCGNDSEVRDMRPHGEGS